jgi:hypothetical protein
MSSSLRLAVLLVFGLSVPAMSAIGASGDNAQVEAIYAAELSRLKDSATLKMDGDFTAAAGPFTIRINVNDGDIHTFVKQDTTEKKCFYENHDLAKGSLFAKCSFPKPRFGTASQCEFFLIVETVGLLLTVSETVQGGTYGCEVPENVWKGYLSYAPTQKVLEELRENARQVVATSGSVKGNASAMSTPSIQDASDPKIGGREPGSAVAANTWRQEQDQLRQEGEREQLRIEAEKRKLELLRLALEQERLRQQQASLNERPSVMSRPSKAIQDSIPPIIETAASLETTAGRVTLSGKVRDDNRLTRVEINGEEVPFTRSGDFSAELTVAIGESRIRIAAFDSEGNKSERTVTVNRRRNIPDIAYGNFHALVVGIDEYDSLPKLKSAVVDARAVAATLKSKYDFEVQLLENPSRDALIDMLDS